MNKVVNTVCDNWFSGTDDPVRLKFKSYKYTPSLAIPYTCETNILDTGIIGYRVNDWATGSTQTWGHERWDDVSYGIQDHNFLGPCAKDFRSYDQLMFQVVIPPTCDEHVFEPDDVEICKLVVTFGKNESEMWEWSQAEGTSSWTSGSHWDGANTNWLLLKRVSKMARS